MYFAGDGIGSLTLEDRMTLTNMAIEAGGKNGVCDVDEKTLRYVRAAATCRTGKSSATMPKRQLFHRARMGPGHAGAAGRQAAQPGQSDTAHNCRDVKLDQAYIGKLHRRQNHRHDLRRQHPQRATVKIPTFVVPGSTEVHADMKRLNLRGVEKGPNEKSIEDILLDAGCLRRLQRLRAPAWAARPTPSAGSKAPKSASAPPTAISPAEWAAPRSAVYLASPLTVAASALTGHVTDPREYVTGPIQTGMAGVL